MTITTLKLCTQIRKILWDLKLEVCRYLTYSLDLTPSDFHLFCPLKEYADVKRFSCDAKIEHEVQTWLMEQLQH
jgi:hypothetical protein